MPHVVCWEQSTRAAGQAERHWQTGWPSAARRGACSPLGPRKQTWCAPWSMLFTPHSVSRSDTRTPVQVEQEVPEGPQLKPIVCFTMFSSFRRLPAEYGLPVGGSKRVVRCLMAERGVGCRRRATEPWPVKANCTAVVRLHCRRARRPLPACAARAPAGTLPPAGRCAARGSLPAQRPAAPGGHQVRHGQLLHFCFCRPAAPVQPPLQSGAWEEGVLFGVGVQALLCMTACARSNTRQSATSPT